MDKTLKLIIAAIMLVVGIFISGYVLGKDRMKKKLSGIEVSYQAEIDSLAYRLDTAMARIDLEYSKKKEVIIRTKYKFIKEQQDNEKQEYFSLDTTGRVADFRARLRKRMGQSGSN